MPTTSTTARLGYLTLALQAACLLLAFAVYLVEHFAPGAVEGGTGLTAQQALLTISAIAVGGGVGGGVATAGHGVRHLGTRAPTSAMQAAAAAAQPAALPDNPPDADADATVPA